MNELKEGEALVDLGAQGLEFRKIRIICSWTDVYKMLNPASILIPSRTKH